MGAFLHYLRQQASARGAIFISSDQGIGKISIQGQALFIRLNRDRDHLATVPALKPDGLVR
jgi:hypothetical protein